MLFAGSNLEERFNRFWNDNLVATDFRIKKLISDNKNSLWHIDQKLLIELTRHYIHQSKNFLNNLQRQVQVCDDEGNKIYTDHEYILHYIQSSENQILEDLNHYQALKPLTHVQTYIQEIDFSQKIATNAF